LIAVVVIIIIIIIRPQWEVMS